MDWIKSSPQASTYFSFQEVKRSLPDAPPDLVQILITESDLVIDVPFDPYFELGVITQEAGHRSVRELDGLDIKLTLDRVSSAGPETVILPGQIVPHPRRIRKP